MNAPVIEKRPVVPAWKSPDFFERLRGGDLEHFHIALKEQCDLIRVAEEQKRMALDDWGAVEAKGGLQKIATAKATHDIAAHRRELALLDLYTLVKTVVAR